MNFILLNLNTEDIYMFRREMFSYVQWNGIDIAFLGSPIDMVNSWKVHLYAEEDTVASK